MRATAPAAMHGAMTIEHRVDGADGRTVHEVGHLLPELLPSLGSAPPCVLALQVDDASLDRLRQLVGLPLRPTPAIAEADDPTSLYRS
jgi:hypothetical protein